MAWQSLVESHLPLVRRLVRRLAERAQRLDMLDDLLQVGFFGLVEAAQRFRPEAQRVFTSGESDAQECFRAFARPRVEGAVVDELRRMDWRPRRVSRSAIAVAEAMSALEQRLGRAATERELARAMGMALHDYQRMVLDIECGQLDTLLEDPVSSLREGPDFVDWCDKKEYLKRALAALPVTERQLLHFYYHQGFNQCEIAAVFRLTEARVCQLHKQALLRLRAWSTTESGVPASGSENSC